MSNPDATLFTVPPFYVEVHVNDDLMFVLEKALLLEQFVLLDDLAAGDVRQIMRPVDPNDPIVIVFEPLASRGGRQLGPEIKLPVNWRCIPLDEVSR